MMALCTLARGQALPAVDESKLPPLRSNNALVAIPDGWARSSRKVEGVLALAPQKPPKEGVVEIFVEGAGLLDKKSLATIADEIFLNTAKEEKGYRYEGPRVTPRHPAGYRALSMYTSCVDNGTKIGNAPRAYYLSTYLDDGDGAYQPFTLYASSPELIAQYRPTFEKFVNNARLLGGIPLAKPVGDETLTLGTVYYLCDFLEHLLDVPFTRTQRDALKAELIEIWARRNAEEVKGVHDLFDARDTIDRIEDKDKKELARQTARTEVLKVAREEARGGDKMAKMLVDLVDGAQRPLAAGKAGEPPLTRQAADATLELLYFMASKGVDPAHPDANDTRPGKAQLDAWAAQLAAGYGAMGLEEKRNIAEMPLLWASFRVAWNESPVDEKAQAAAAWAKDAKLAPMIADIRSRPKSANLDEAAKAMRQLQIRQELLDQFNRTMNYKPPKW